MALHRCFLLTILFIVGSILHNTSEAEAATPIAKSSIDPPSGNSLFRTVNASGVQIYECEQNSNGTGLQYVSVAARATLYPSDSSNGVSVGHHYYLSEPIAEGGKPTYAFSVNAGDPVSANPESTVTVIVLVRKTVSNKDIAELLVKAVSHSGHGVESTVSYVQRRNPKGGVAPSSACEEVGKQVEIPYTTQYLFWQQDRSFQIAVPVEIRVSKHYSPFLSFYTEGTQFYRFNGSSWINFNVSSYLYTSPGQEVLGWHYFATKPDRNGGQPTWELFMPLSRVTVKVVSSITVDSASIDWTEMKATSHGGNKNGLLEKVKYMQRVSTVGGLPPKITSGSAVVGDEYLSPFSAIYWFYA